MKTRVAFLLGICLLVFVFLSAQTTSPTAEGDGFYVQREDVSKAWQAVAKYKEELKNNPASYEALWKIAKTLYYIGKQVKTNREKMGIFQQGIDFGKRAVAGNAQGAEGHFWLGVNYAKYGEARGVLKSLFLKGDIMDEMNIVLRLDEAYEGAGANRVLGRVYYKVPGLFGGSNKKSRQCLEKAKALCPQNTLTLLYLAETYWALGEKQLAVKTLEELLATVADERWLPETKADKDEAAKLLEKYRKKLQ